MGLTRIPWGMRRIRVVKRRASLRAARTVIAADGETATFARPVGPAPVPLDPSRRRVRCALRKEREDPLAQLRRLAAAFEPLQRVAEDAVRRLLAAAPIIRDGLGVRRERRAHRS